LSFQLSPYPSLWVTRYVFNKEANKANKLLEAFVPDKIESKLNIQYDVSDNDAFLDVYYHKDSVKLGRKLPVIVWTHGGGLISGNKSQLSNYCKMLAGYGYVSISVDYTVAPKKQYPTPLRQLNHALKFITENAATFHIDSSSIILAGDSGGSMVSAQVANIITNRNYAELVNINPGVAPHQLKGLLLYCGIYDVNNLNSEGKFGSFLEMVKWAYFGKEDISKDEYAKSATVTDYLTSNFPPAFISAGNADPLLAQSHLLVKKLSAYNVYIDTLFYANNHYPALKHEYQFTYNEAGKVALKRSLKFAQFVLQ
jgi:acetyl esterase/lipase